MAHLPTFSPFSRRNFLHLSALGAATALAPSLQVNAATPSRPNILFIMADQHRGDCVGADGNAAIHTPTLDRLAADGARFRCAYSSTPTCTPARAALLTGLSPWNHGMLGYNKVAEKYTTEMPQILRDAGYFTLGIGKMHWSPQRSYHGFHQIILDESGRVQSPDFISDYRAWFASQAPNLDPDATGIGFNSYRAGKYVLPEELHPTHWTAAVARRFIEGYNRPEPFFMKVSFARPHSPYDPPERWMNFYTDRDIPAADVGNWASRYEARSSQEDTLWHGDLGAKEVRHSRQGYYGSISFIDEQIGTLLEALEKKGQLENTLIVYTSDHGDMVGDHHMWRKSYAYEGSARVPMIIRWPKGMLEAQRGQVLNHPVEIRDILPTFMDAAECTTAHKLDGRSMLDAIRGVDDWRTVIDLEHDVCYSKANHWSALTDGKTKYIFHARDGEEQLFDLTKDPGEVTDLAGDGSNGALLKSWRDQMIAHLEIRGEDWVKGGQLALRPESILRSPNYPG